MTTKRAILCGLVAGVLWAGMAVRAKGDEKAAEELSLATGNGSTGGVGPGSQDKGTITFHKPMVRKDLRLQKPNSFTGGGPKMPGIGPGGGWKGPGLGHDVPSFGPEKLPFNRPFASETGWGVWYFHDGIEGINEPGDLPNGFGLDPTGMGDPFEDFLNQLHSGKVPGNAGPDGGYYGGMNPMFWARGGRAEAASFKCSRGDFWGQVSANAKLYRKWSSEGTAVDLVSDLFGDTPMTCLNYENGDGSRVSDCFWYEGNGECTRALVREKLPPQSGDTHDDQNEWGLAVTLSDKKGGGGSYAGPEGNGEPVNPKYHPAFLRLHTSNHAPALPQAGDAQGPVTDPVPVTVKSAGAGAVEGGDALAAAGAAKAETALQFIGRRPGFGVTDPAEWQQNGKPVLAIRRAGQDEITDPAEPLTAMVSAVSGDAQKLVAEGGKTRWEPVRAGDRLSAWAVVRTGLGSRVELSLGGGGQVVVHSGTKVGLGQETGQTRLDLAHGSLSYGVAPRGAAPAVQFRTPGGTLQARGAGEIAYGHGTGLRLARGAEGWSAVASAARPGSAQLAGPISAGQTRTVMMRTPPSTTGAIASQGGLQTVLTGGATPAARGALARAGR